MLNTYSPIPLYHQLAEILENKIQDGEFVPDDRIPAETKLAEIYGIGRPTVRQAIDILVKKGMVVRRRGAGTYVKQPSEAVDLFSLAGTLSSFHKKGITVKSRTIQQTKSVPVDDRPGNPFTGGRAYRYTRLSMVEKKPVLLEEMYLHPELFHGIDKIDMEGRSLSQLVQKHYYMTPVGGRQNFRIAFTDGTNAALLEISKQTPILEVERLIHFEGARNAIYAILSCRTDRFVFSQTIGGYPYA